MAGIVSDPTLHATALQAPALHAALTRKVRKLGRRLVRPRWRQVWAARRGVCPPEGTGWNFTVRQTLRCTVGIDIHRVRPAGDLRLTRSTLDIELDESFNHLIDTAVELSGSGPRGFGEGAFRHRQRLYHLLQLPVLTHGVPGLVVECGTYRGLSAYLLCRALAKECVGYAGGGFHIFDSFEGISPLGPEDRPGDRQIPSGKARAAGMFSAPLETVRRTLVDFPDVQFHPGWIPAALEGALDEPVRFAHLDLDVYEPTKAALRCLFMRLNPGGALLCDDYGAIRWPGVTRAVDEFCRDVGREARLLRLSTGQALLLRG